MFVSCARFLVTSLPQYGSKGTGPDVVSELAGHYGGTTFVVLKHAMVARDPYVTQPATSSVLIRFRTLIGTVHRTTLTSCHRRRRKASCLLTLVCAAESFRVPQIHKQTTSFSKISESLG